jgi:hypothetical protein
MKAILALLWTIPLSLSAHAIDAPRVDRVGLPMPEYMTGEECLFCHRNDIGPDWLKTSHAWTTRAAGDPPTVASLPADATHVIGGVNAYMALKLVSYGKVALYSTRNEVWREGVFEERCAGCHTTGVDPQTLAFSSSGLDCVSCHGLVPAEHTTNGALAWFGKGHKGSPKLKEAICAQCHLRGGKSRSTGRPYPNNFFAGDDLFADFNVDLKNTRGLDRNDQHVYVKTRSVLEGRSRRTCDNCHKIHVPPGARKRDPKLHSAVCGY